LNNDRVVQEVLLWTDLLGEDVRPSVAAVPDVPVIIMAGGKGTRLDPFTKILPKPLIPFQDKPIIEHIMDRFYASGFSRFMLIVNYKKEIIKMYFAENALPYEIQFIEEDDYYGTAGGLYLLESVIKNTFIMTNCDTLLQGDCSDFLKWHKDRNNLMTIVGSHREITVPYGVLKMNNGNLFTMIEKPKMDLFINTGTYVFDPDIFNYITERKVMNMDELINVVRVDQENRIGVYPHWGGWFDLGQWDEYNKSLKIIGGHLNEI
jgi:NDP-sugar pyrophosphorylase family protein